jgi:hypothetical protein
VMILFHNSEWRSCCVDNYYHGGCDDFDACALHRTAGW